MVIRDTQAQGAWPLRKEAAGMDVAPKTLLRGYRGVSEIALTRARRRFRPRSGMLGNYKEKPTRARGASLKSNAALTHLSPSQRVGDEKKPGSAA
ncbi:MAG: hypothetical protein QM741_17705 [Rudaea sp.]|uniref:hypothetical protein n=1 Tax=Rudaea sp. TaxID=2136325 RepID=UPI0039E2B578